MRQERGQIIVKWEKKYQIHGGSNVAIDGPPNRGQRGGKVFTKGEKMMMHAFGHNRHQPQI